MNHDDGLTDASLSPEIVVLTDALQLRVNPENFPCLVDHKAPISRCAPLDAWTWWS